MFSKEFQEILNQIEAKPELNALFLEHYVNVESARNLLALEGTKEGVWDWELETDVVHFSSQWFQILGYLPNELPHKFSTWEDLVHQDDLHTAKEKVQAFLLSDGEYWGKSIQRMRTKSGQYIYTEHKAKLLKNPEGKGIRLIGTIRDVNKEHINAIELEQKNTLLDTIFNASPHLIFIKDKYGNFIKVNKAVGALFNLPLEDLEFKPNAEVHGHNEEVQNFDRIDNIVLLENKSVTLIEPFTKFNGDVRLFQTIKSPMTFHGEKYVLGLSTDITELEERNNKIEENLRYQESILQSLPFYFLEFNHSFTFNILNKNHDKLIPIVFNNQIDFNNLIHTDDRKHLDTIAEFLNSNSVHLFLELQLNTHKGPKWFKFYLSKSVSDKKKIFGSLIPDHENVNNRIALEESLITLQTIQEEAVDLILILDSSFKVLNSSQSSKTVLGIAASRITGTPFFDLLENEVRNVHIESIKKLKKGEYLKFTFLRKYNNKEFFLEALFKLLKTPSTSNSTYLAFIRDNTESKRLELEKEKINSALQKLADERTSFVSMASHQFRTPLTIIRGNTELIQYKLQKKNLTDFDTHLNRITTEIDRVTNLMNDILLLGKLSSKKQDYKPEEVDLANFVEGLVVEFNERNIEIDSSSFIFIRKQQNIQVLIDKLLFSHVVYNLFDNAFKYGKSNIPIEVIVEKSNEYGILKVKDYGIGIPVNSLISIFESFYRAPNTQSIEGTGLGLPIAKQIIELFNGEIFAQSDGSNGCMFTIRIPLTCLPESSKF